MKKLFCIFGCIVPFLCGSTLVASSIMGKFNANGEKVTTTYHKGLAQIDYSQVESDLEVLGKLESSNSVYHGRLISMGLARLSQVIIKGQSEFAGKLFADQVQFEGLVFLRSDQGSVFKNTILLKDLNFTGNEIHFEGASTFKKIVVNPHPEVPQNPILYVGPGVNISGDVVFEQLPGKIFLAPGAIFSGRVINGERVK